jgi:NADH-quinone oxidoreductase subunit D
MLRLDEMRESSRIITQCVDYLTTLRSLNDNSYYFDDSKQALPLREFMKIDMESLIHHFKFATEGLVLAREESYSLVEAPKGEFGIYIASDDATRLKRCRIKAPGFVHLQGLDFMARGALLADLVAIIGTQDLVFGEIDR